MTITCWKTRWWVFSVFPCIVAALPSLAYSVTLEGVVVDIKGETLPGVAVTVQGSNHQALTNVLGTYKLTLPAGTHLLFFHKSGYTPGRFEITLPASGKVSAQPVTLWCLPPANGVFLYDNYRYRATRGVEREIFLAQDGNLLYGTIKFDPDHPESPYTENSVPKLICFNMPRAGVTLHRFERKEIVLEDVRQGTPVKIWLPADAIPAELIAIDEPEGLLQQIRINQPLEPGVYAVHWGAFDSAEKKDPRMFLFSVRPNRTTHAKENDTLETAPEHKSEPQKEIAPPAKDKSSAQPAKLTPPKNKPEDDLDLMEPELHDM